MYNNYNGKQIVFEKLATLTLNETDDTCESDAFPRGSISTATLTLTISCISNVEATSEPGKSLIKELTYYIDYQWNKAPFNIKVDGVTVNWDSAIFTYKANSFISDNRAYQNNQWYTYKTITQPDLAQQGGIGYSVYMSYTGGVSGECNLQKLGRAWFTLIPTANPTYMVDSSFSIKNVTSISVNYVHDKTPFFGSIGFSYAGLGVSINPPALNDSQSTTANVYYVR